MIKDQHNELLYLQREMKKVAIPIGPQHSWWELIADIDTLFDGAEKTRIGMDTDKVIETAKEWIKDHSAKSTT